MKRNSGKSEYRIQNQFTKYLHVAVIRTRNHYLQRRDKQYAELLCHDDSSDFLENLQRRECKSDMQVNNIELAYEMCSILEELPENALTVIRLRIYQMYEFDEIASFTGLSYANVRNIYYRALRQLRRHIDE